MPEYKVNIDGQQYKIKAPDEMALRESVVRLKERQQNINDAQSGGGGIYLGGANLDQPLAQQPSEPPKKSTYMPTNPVYQVLNNIMQNPQSAVRGLQLGGKAVAEGVTSGLDFLASPVRAPLNALLQVTGNQQIAPLQDLAAQIPVQPQTGLEKTIYGATRGATAALPTIAGGLGVAAMRGAPEAAKLAGQFLSSSPLLQQTAGFSGGASGSLAEQAGAGPVGQTLAAIAGATVPAVAGANLAKQAAQRANPLVTADQLKAKANALYAEAEKTGAVLKPEFSTDKLADKMATLRPFQARGGLLSPQIQQLSKKLDPDQVKLGEIADVFDEMRGKPMSLGEAQQIDEMLSAALDGFKDPRNGALTKSGKRLYDMQTEFRGILDDVTPDAVIGGDPRALETWKQAKKVWFQQIKAREIEKIIADGELMDNPATSIRSGFRTLIKNPKRFNKYTPEERNLIKKAASADLPQEILRSLGSRLIGVISFGMAPNSPVASLAAGTLSTGVGEIARGTAGRAQAELGRRVISQVAGQKLPRTDVDKLIQDLAKIYALQANTQLNAANLNAKSLNNAAQSPILNQSEGNYLQPVNNF